MSVWYCLPWKLAAKISLLYAFRGLIVATSMHIFLCAIAISIVVGSYIVEEISLNSVKE